MTGVAIDADGLWSRLMQMAALGATEKGGVNRQAFTALDHKANRLLADWALAAGFSVSADPIGNLFIRREGLEPEAAPVMFGSHLDSQPTGGRFDGAAGVLSAFEVLLAFNAAGQQTRRPLICVAWRNEEGSRFQPSCMGSRVFAGELALDAALATTDREGVRVAEALGKGLEGIPCAPNAGFALAAYLELHIEQGPELEQRGLMIGAVSGIQGRRRYEITLTGSEAHAGTTPHGLRRDALRSAAQMITGFYDEILPIDARIRFTVGALEVFPNSTNTVPGSVRFTIDLRHPEQEMLARIDGLIRDITKANASPCEASLKLISAAEPVAFPDKIVDMVGQNAEALGLGHMPIASGAGHDAAAIAALAPTGMVFIPCRDGLSHNEAEWAEPEALAAGTRVLAACVTELAGAPGA